MRPRADRSAPARRIPAGAAADPRRPSSRPRRLSYAVAVANSPIDKSAALALRRPLMRWGNQGRSLLQNQSTKMSGGCCGPLARSSFGLIFSSEKKAADWVGRFFVEPML